jgi:hypothetical protein
MVDQVERLDCTEVLAGLAQRQAIAFAINFEGFQRELERG